MKYYLLTFNEDWADEHNVPALACFNEEQYQKWLKRPSGKLNKNYDQEVVNFNLQKEKYDTFVQGMKDMNIYTKYPKDFSPVEKEWYEANKVNYTCYIDAPSKVSSNIRAYLGNNGDGFEERFNRLYLMEEFVAEGIVKVIEVDKSFFDYFHKANLSDLSLSNIFREDIMEYFYDDEDET